MNRVLPPHPRLPPHPPPFQWCKKNKTWFVYCHVLAVSSFTSSPFRSGVSVHSAYTSFSTILHYIPPTFISPTSAPHTAKSNSSLHFAKPPQAFRVMAFLSNATRWLLFLKSYKAANALSKLLMPPKPPTWFAPFRSVIAFALDHRTIETVCFIFSCGSVYPSLPTKRHSIPIEI